METKNFSITIHASKEKVWQTLWDDATYREWTTAFIEGSWAKTDHFKKGSKVLFLDDKNDGMVSIVAENKPNEYMSFEHIGEAKKGVEDLESAKNQGWAGAHENYTLKATEGGTEVSIELDVDENAKQMVDYFMATWPKALSKLKEIAERD